MTTYESRMRLEAAVAEASRALDDLAGYVPVAAGRLLKARARAGIDALRSLAADIAETERRDQ